MDPERGNSSNQRGGKKRSGQRLALNYYSSKSRGQYNQSPFERKASKYKFRPGRFLSRSIDLVLIAAIFLGLIYSLIVGPTALLDVNSTDYHSQADYQAAVDKQLGGFKDSNKISFDQARVVKNLKSQFPEIARASVELPLLSQKPKVKLVISKPAFWLNSNSQTFLINNAGVAISSKGLSSEIKGLKTIEDKSGYQTSSGKQILSSGSVNFIIFVIKQSQQAKIPIAKLVLPAKADEVELYTTDRSYFVKFFLGGDPSNQMGRFLASRHHFDQSGNQPSQYLDVRVDGKVYYQ